MNRLVLVLLLASCKGYHHEPNWGVQYGELDTTTPIVHSDTEGWTASLGGTFVNRTVPLPTYDGPSHREMQLEAEVAALREKIEALQKPAEEPAASETTPETLIDAVASSPWTWPSVAALAIAAFIFWVWMRRKRSKDG